MSNFLAIATVTGALSHVLQEAIGTDVPGATVTTVRPEGASSGIPATGVNVFLFQVTPNGAFRNADLPTRRADGQVIRRPAIAMDLHYLMTFYGNDSQLEPQRLLGSVVRTIQAQPVLTRQVIRDTLASPTYAFLSPSDLGESVEQVKFAPSALSLEELAKLWSVFYQIPYALSIAYVASVVCIEGDVSPRPALPVRTRNLTTTVFRQPAIAQVVPVEGADQPIVLGATVRILGQQLGSFGTLVRIAGVDVAPVLLTDTEIQVPLASPPLPAGALRAGIQGLQVIEPALFVVPPVAHAGVESNVAPFVLRPTITNVSVANVTGTGTAPRSAEVTLQLSPVVGASQRTLLLLNERSVNNPSAYTVVAPNRSADGASITFAISGVKAAGYLVRVQVAGAESVLVVDTNAASPTFNQYVGPTVTIP